MKRAAFALISLFAACAWPTLAQTMDPKSDDPKLHALLARLPNKRWRPVTYERGVLHSFDSQRAKRAGDKVDVWERQDYYEVDRTYGGPIDRLLAHMTIDCSEMKTRVSSLILYLRGEVKKEYSMPADVEWKELPTGSVIEDFATKVCKAVPARSE